MMNLPNSLTVFRLVAVPGIVLSYGYEYYVISTGLFVIAALTDGLDGYAARQTKQVTPLGSFLDPVADKILVVSVLILLIHDESLDVMIPGGLIILREILVSSLREWMAHASKKVPVSNAAKAKTASQMVALIFLLSHYHPMVTYLGIMCLWCSALLAGYSMLDYLRKARSQFKKA